MSVTRAAYLISGTYVFILPNICRSTDVFLTTKKAPEECSGTFDLFTLELLDELAEILLYG